MDNRKPTTEEISLIRILLEKASINMEDGWEQTLYVSSMNDGGMGSIYLHFYGEPLPDPNVQIAADYQFKDDDGVVVIASLYATKQNWPVELDIWKTDFSPLIRIPVIVD